jgi:hypothetical protein
MTHPLDTKSLKAALIEGFSDYITEHCSDDFCRQLPA